MIGKTPKNRRKARPAWQFWTHGLRRTYRRGCRCEPCREANTAYTQRYRADRREEMAIR